jgi:D-alanyl-D-alanine carboxypeptidase
MNQNNNSNPVSPELADRFQSTLDRTVKDIGIPGASVSIINRNGTWFGASGVSNLETQDKMRSDDILGVGSTTKAFTAATVLKTVESGKLSLDDTLGQWLPEIVQQIPDSENITLRQLLNGTSGIYDYTNNPQFFQDVVTDFLTSSTKEWKPEDLVAYALDKPRFSGQATIGQWTYPNTGNILASMIVAKAIGKEFKDVLKEQVLNPLGLKDTFYGREGLNSIDRDRLASGYQDLVTADGKPGQDGIPENLTDLNPDVFQSTGGMFSNTQDLARFSQALFGGELLKSKSLQEMLNLVQVTPDYQWGLGMDTETNPWGTSIGRGGGHPGYDAVFKYFPELNSTLVVEVNRQLENEDPRKAVFMQKTLQSSLFEASELSSQAAINGTSDDDDLQGTPDNDIINGLEGNDTLSGKDGNDVLNGRTGSDRLLGESGEDYLFGKEGNDFLDGGEDIDLLNGGLDNDTLIGGNGNDGFRNIHFTTNIRPTRGYQLPVSLPLVTAIVTVLVTVIIAPAVPIATLSCRSQTQ